MAIEYPIYIIHRDGHVHVARDLDSAARHAGVITLHHRTHVPIDLWTDMVVHDDWIARDALGAVVRPEDLLRPRRPAAWRVRHAEAAQHAARLGLPIPGTGVRRFGGRRRIAHYAGERRQDAAMRADLDGLGLESRFHFRQRRIGTDPYEAEWRSPQRSWKASRRTRWK